jgi:hypothetical protein
MNADQKVEESNPFFFSDPRFSAVIRGNNLFLFSVPYVPRW